MALILNIETSSPVCSVCLSHDGEMIAIREDDSGTNHASVLTVFIQELLWEQKLTIGQLDAIAVSAGPGSYTGLRIGAATAKGICYALSKPLIAIDSLVVLTQGMRSGLSEPNLLYCPTIDARRNEIYYSLINSANEVIIPSTNTELSPVVPFDIPEGFKIVVGGRAAKKVLDVWKSEELIPDFKTRESAKWMIARTEKKFTKALFEDTSHFEPSYIKPVYIATAKKPS